MTDLILTETHGAITLLTFNRPAKLNALSYALIDRLMHILDRIEDDARIHAVILTGAGDRAFSAGGDIPEFSESIRQGPDAALKAFVRRGQAMTARLESFPRNPSSLPSTGLHSGAAVRSPKLLILRSPASALFSPSRRSTLVSRRRLEERSACLASQAGSARWNCSSPATPSRRNAPTRSGSSIASWRMSS